MTLLKKHLGIVILCVSYIVLSFLTYKSYGITGDEQSAYDLGKEYISYFGQPSNYTNTIAPLVGKSDRQLMGVPLFSQYYRLYPTMLSLLNPSGYYEWYHLLNLLFSTSIFILMYIAGYAVYRKQNPALIFPVMVFLTPRLFGDLAANPKDMPFAIFYFVSLLTIYLFRNTRPTSNRGLVKIIVLGILFGLTQSQRIVGFTIYPLYLIFSIAQIVKTKQSSKTPIRTLLGTIFGEGILIAAVAFLLMLATWPLMGMNVLQNLSATFSSTQKYLLWDNTALYLGQNITNTQRPWHYLFVWIGITLPIPTLILFFYGLRKIRTWVPDSFLSLLTGALALNILLYLVINPVLYNGIRHFLYLLPIIIFVAGSGLIDVLKVRTKIFAKAILVILIIYYGTVAYHTIRLFPHHYVYFNEIVGNSKGAVNAFETDYWGTAYKEASDWVISFVNTNRLQNIKVYSCNVSFAVQYYAKGQFAVVGRSKDADFILCDTERDRVVGYSYPIVQKIVFDDTDLIYIRYNDRKTLDTKPL